MTGIPAEMMCSCGWVAPSSGSRRTTTMTRNGPRNAFALTSCFRTSVASTSRSTSASAKAAPRRWHRSGGTMIKRQGSAIRNPAPHPPRLEFSRFVPGRSPGRRAALAKFAGAIESASAPRLALLSQHSNPFRSIVELTSRDGTDIVRRELSSTGPSMNSGR